METVINEQSRQNTAYVRRLLRQKQPAFSAALELAVLLAELGASIRIVPAQPCVRHDRDTQARASQGGAGGSTTVCDRLYLLDPSTMYA